MYLTPIPLYKHSLSITLSYHVTQEHVFDKLSVPPLFRNNMGNNRFLTRYSFCIYHVSCSSIHDIYDVSSLIVIFLINGALILFLQRKKKEFIITSFPMIDMNRIRWRSYLFCKMIFKININHTVKMKKVHWCLD